MKSDSVKKYVGLTVLVLYSALLLGFALMQVALPVILALGGAYLLVVFTMVYYLAKYQKEM